MGSVFRGVNSHPAGGREGGSLIFVELKFLTRRKRRESGGDGRRDKDVLTGSISGGCNISLGQHAENQTSDDRSRWGSVWGVSGGAD